MTAETVFIEKINEVWIKITSTDDSILIALYEHFTFQVPGYKYTPAYKTGAWDGKIHLYQLGTKRLYLGLLNKAINFCHQQGYVVSLNNFQPQLKNVTIDSIKQFTDALSLTSKDKPIEIRDYQLAAIQQCINAQKALILSPTSSGKSLIIYSLIKWYQQILDNPTKKILIIVPTLSLIEQMSYDFNDYDKNYTGFIKESVHKIHAGQEKYHIPEDKQIYISTWQSIHNIDKPQWYQQLEVVMIDECINPDSKVSMANGSLVRINDIKENDLVLTLNETNNKIESNKVIKVHKNLSKNKKYKIKLDDGSYLIVTGNHKVKTDTGWKRIDELTTQDYIICL